MGYKRRYRRSSASAVVSDMAYIGSKVSWQRALLLGTISFGLFYFALPASIESLLNERQNSTFYPILEAVLARRVHWLQWIGIACGLVGLFFSLRNYYFVNTAGRNERSLAAFIAKLFGRSIG
ncbi:hypothetical protein C8R11_12240 [Nitrosomonas aestuarii]|nr:hypothetical protein C8R11_12240 [Nitrosomonas aestuarii]